ncbi:unnamed protein product [Aphanomyces euteiches]|uniref:Hexose transporter 1 n=1 Tax=Aphanomyces euteiches TaxID=100861 RepID=A0A6G0WUY3_9STRA|nr:hypothetical protein Ae201684_011526 [Aphanomyces euteiches]KAH9096904.1 hypothetical protein Ae201684P_011639 [Aphanomyces euteiches]
MKATPQDTEFRISSQSQSTQDADFNKMESDNKDTNGLVASTLMRCSLVSALVGAVHFGWMMGEMGYLPFNNVKFCAMPRIPAGQCILFPGHSNAEWTMQSTAWAVGGGIGALLSAFPADTFGRQRTLGWNGLLMIAGGFVQMFAGDIYTFAIGRGINGLASGIAINVLNNYLREISPVQWRMFYVTMVQLALSTGALIVTSLMYAISKLPNEWEYKYLFGGPILLGVLQLAFMGFIIESPAWLIQTHQVERSLEVMNQLYQPGDVESHWKAQVESISRQNQEVQSSSKLGLLLSPKYSKQFSIAVVLAMMQQLCGMNALVVYGPQLFQAIGVRELRLSNTLVNFSRLDNMFLAARYGDRFSRRTLLLVGSMGMAFGALGFVLCQVYPNDTSKWFSIVCMVVFVGSFCFSIGSLGWLVSTELVPETLGATSGAIATLFTWTAQFFIGVYFQQISNVAHWGDQAFAIFAVVNLLFFFFVYAFVPDTRNKTSDQVTAMFCPSSESSKDNAFVFWNSDNENCILSSP